MRRFQKKQAEDFVALLDEAHNEIMKAFDDSDLSKVMDLLCQCQEGAIELGSFIEKLEGEGCETIHVLEAYCEAVYVLYEAVGRGSSDTKETAKVLSVQLKEIKASIENGIKVRTEVVFLPYKADMWDSLESVWKAAMADPDCDVYVIPIPYYGKNPNGTFGTFHYDGYKFPYYVPITHYEEYNMAVRRPDVIYIHNPYDFNNRVTSIDPRFYSQILKEYTECLVYIPYYATSGGMAESQYSCVAYYNADYIVVQSEKHREYFDADLPDEKFLPFGSPKFDRTIELCKNPPKPPAVWKNKLEGRKVYFYNTSIGGMLSDTRGFLDKMRYVFDCFKGRMDVCLLWRPHPLLETTFDSMRPGMRAEYEELKKYYIENDIGIYDETPDIEETIAQCDAYIGDSGTSVTSLFGVAGKPMFILNNDIHTAPGKDDWRGEIIKGFMGGMYDRWIITQGNKLYHSPDNDYSYKYYCDLSEYSGGWFYSRAIELNGKVYVCPANAQDILVIAGGRIERRIELVRHVAQGGAFCAARDIGRYIFLIPNRYPAIVRYDTETDEIKYLEGYNEIFTASVNGQQCVGISFGWNEYLLVASPADNRVMVVDSGTLDVRIFNVGKENTGGCIMMRYDGMDIWMLPYSGYTVKRWNPLTGEVREYSDAPADFKCRQKPKGMDTNDRPFSSMAFCGDKVILAPYWGSSFLCLDKNTGVFEEWKNAAGMMAKNDINEYYMSWSYGNFLFEKPQTGKNDYRYYSAGDRKLYNVNVETGRYTEIEVRFDYNELKAQEAGFADESPWLMYCCKENAFNSLTDFLDGNIKGNKFDKDKQLASYALIAATVISNHEGTCGERVHRFIMNRVR